MDTTRHLREGLLPHLVVGVRRIPRIVENDKIYLRRLMASFAFSCGHAGLNSRAFAHSGDRASLHRRTDCDGALPDDSLMRSNCFACDETKPAWVHNGNEPTRVSPLHSMLVRMPRGTTGDAFRATGSPASGAGGAIPPPASAKLGASSTPLGYHRVGTTAHVLKLPIAQAAELVHRRCHAGVAPSSGGLP